MAEIRSLKPRREILANVVAKDLAAAVDEAIANGVTGYVLITENADQWEMAARINAPRVRECIGFMECDAKPTLIAVLKGDG